MPCPTYLSGDLPQPLGSLLLGSAGTPFQYSILNLEVALLSYLADQPAVVCTVGTRFFPHFVPRDNAIWPVVTYFRASTDHQHMLSGSAGFAYGDISLDVWSPNYLDVVETSESIRSAMQGFQGAWGAVGVYQTILTAESDQIERPGDGSSTWWYSRSLDYRISFQEPMFQPG
jgi:hypothetical protein